MNKLPYIQIINMLIKIFKFLTNQKDCDETKTNEQIPIKEDIQKNLGTSQIKF
jgi:hypothetical protein